MKTRRSINQSAESIKLILYKILCEDMEIPLLNQHHVYRKNLPNISRIPQILKVQNHTKIQKCLQMFFLHHLVDLGPKLTLLGITGSEGRYIHVYISPLSTEVQFIKMLC